MSETWFAVLVRGFVVLVVVMILWEILIAPVASWRRERALRRESQYRESALKLLREYGIDPEQARRDLEETGRVANCAASGTINPDWLKTEQEQSK